MKKTIIAIVLAISLLCLACAAPQSPAAETEAPAAEADAPAAETEAPVETESEQASEESNAGFVFSTATLTGEAIDETYFTDHKLTMVNYWATWCGPCVGEIPDLIDISEEYADKGFAILGVLFGDEDIEGAKSFIASEGVTYPVVNADGVFLQIGQNFTGIPTTFFVDGNGAIITEPIIGSRLGDDWRDIIDDLLKTVG